VTAADEPIPTEAAADEPFQALAGSILDGFLERNPVEASELGEHRYDDRLDDMRPESLDETRRWLSTSLARLAAADARTLSPDNAVDAQILGTALEQQLFLLDEIRAHEWNPLQANPGNGVYLILARNYAPLPERLRALTGRLAAIPEALSVARANLGPMPRVHLETAIGQFTGVRTLLATELERALRNVESMRSEVEPAREAAVEAIEEHVGWLRDQLAAVESGVARERDPRIGPDLFAKPGFGISS
jgi:uncharacterized protein (DUF885 family)